MLCADVSRLIETSNRESSRWKLPLDDRWRVTARDQRKHIDRFCRVRKNISTGYVSRDFPLQPIDRFTNTLQNLPTGFVTESSHLPRKKKKKRNPTPISMQRLYWCERKNSRHKYNIWEKKNTRIDYHFLEREAPKAICNSSTFVLNLCSFLELNFRSLCSLRSTNLSFKRNV